MANQSLYIGVIMFALAFASSVRAQGIAPKKGVEVVPNGAAKRVDVLIDGQPFTSYTWTDQLKVPTLYPILAASGTPITRGFPLEPRPGERVDHPHHAGLWLNYGDVNGVDFWNSSSVLPPAEQAKMGTVLHRRIVKASGGPDRGELEVEMDWIMPDGQKILSETTSYVFRGEAGRRMIDHTTTLTALDKEVALKDDKEGMFGLRVRRELEQPTNESVVYIEADGKPGTVKSIRKDDTTGEYRSSEGKVGDAVWSTRGRWVSLTGKVKDEAITIAMLDHPQNVGFPTYWHARGYGLFSANPLGQAAFSNGKDKLNFTLAPKQSTTFRYRVIVLSGAAPAEQIETQYRQFVEPAKAP